MNRIEQIQQAHPWCLEREARLLLTTHYMVSTRLMKLSGDELDEEMNNVVSFYRDLPRKELEKGIRIAEGMGGQA